MDNGSQFEKEFFIGDDEQIRTFATGIKDTNPLHHDNEAARASGLLGIIAPGVMAIGFVSSTIAAMIPKVMVCKMDMKFMSPLYAGSRAAVLCTIASKRARVAKISVSIKSGAEFVAKGMCIVALPKE